MLLTAWRHAVERDARQDRNPISAKLLVASQSSIEELRAECSCPADDETGEYRGGNAEHPTRGDRGAVGVARVSR